MATVHTFQAMSAPEGGTSNAAPEGVIPPSIRHQPGVVSVNGEGPAVTTRPNGLNTSEWQSGSAGILSSARTTVGAPSTGGVKASDIITLPNGMEVSVAMAEQLGMVQLDGNGRYVEVQGGVDAASRQSEQEAPVDDAEGFADPKAEADLMELAQTVSPSLQVGAVVDIVKTGDINPLTLNRAASEAGVEPAVMQARVDAMKSHFEAQAYTAVRGFGSDDPQDFFEWAREHMPNSLHEAMHRHGMERTTKPYEPLYRTFIGSMEVHDPHSILEAEFGGGITARKEGGTVLLNIPGKGEVSYGVAVKSGLIKVTDMGRRR
ncbi:hypothetical protein [Methylorubrum populi]|uniref:hypothetical protein n=1 Tax=Methylorubrum populi TaxID=223967 RepID=UPI000DB6DDC2|nr:hypothetical protein [Methylorubrum populi]PZP67940.1 MAG: hypothetical protein DI590_18895 [Methylorubrum populi]